MLTPDQFDQAVTLTGADPDSRATRAARLALVDGSTPNSAANVVGIQPSAVYRAVKRLSAAIDAGCCRTCGKPL